MSESVPRLTPEDTQRIREQAEDCCAKREGVAEVAVELGRQREEIAARRAGLDEWERSIEEMSVEVDQIAAEQGARILESSQFDDGGEKQ